MTQPQSERHSQLAFSIRCRVLGQLCQLYAFSLMQAKLQAEKIAAAGFTVEGIYDKRRPAFINGILASVEDMARLERDIKKGYPHKYSVDGCGMKHYQTDENIGNPFVIQIPKVP